MQSLLRMIYTTNNHKIINSKNQDSMYYAKKQTVYSFTIKQPIFPRLQTYFHLKLKLVPQTLQIHLLFVFEASKLNIFRKGIENPMKVNIKHYILFN